MLLNYIQGKEEKKINDFMMNARVLHFTYDSRG